jgi:hypothetical protein
MVRPTPLRTAVDDTRAAVDGAAPAQTVFASAPVTAMVAAAAAQ